MTKEKIKKTAEPANEEPANTRMDEPGELPEEKKEPAKSAVAPKANCIFCGFPHKKTFDGFGINHDGFDRGGRAEIMFESLCEQERVNLYIPLDTGETAGEAVGGCQLNGLKINILKGVYDIMVPRQAREVVMESLTRTDAAVMNLMTSDRAMSGGANFTWKPANSRLDLKDSYSRNRLNG